MASLISQGAELLFDHSCGNARVFLQPLRDVAFERIEFARAVPVRSRRTQITSRNRAICTGSALLRTAVWSPNLQVAQGSSFDHPVRMAKSADINVRFANPALRSSSVTARPLSQIDPYLTMGVEDP